MNDLVKCVVPVSGGKDSQTCLVLAVKHFGAEHVVGLFCDTQFEHPDTYQHVEYMKELYGVEIITRCEGDVLTECRKWKRFPSDQARFCTDYLKIRPSIKFYKQVAEQQNEGFEIWYGMRTDESDAREKKYGGMIDDELYAAHEIMPRKFPKYLAKMGVMLRLPILYWTYSEVLDFLGSTKNPLYPKFDRVGCFPCQAAGDAHKEKAYQHDAFGLSQLSKVRAVSKEIGKPVFRGKKASQRNNEDQICMFCQI